MLPSEFTNFPKRAMVRIDVPIEIESVVSMTTVDYHAEGKAYGLFFPNLARARNGSFDPGSYNKYGARV